MVVGGEKRKRKVRPTGKKRKRNRGRALRSLVVPLSPIASLSSPPPLTSLPCRLCQRKRQKNPPTMATPDQRAAIDVYGRLRSDLASLLDRVADLEAEAAEHALVARTLEPMEAGRRAYRMVSGRVTMGVEGGTAATTTNATDRLPAPLLPSPGRRRPGRAHRGRGAACGAG